jgi:hypothetical protein
MINNELFYCKNKDTYPPFKDGLYLEEYFLKYMVHKETRRTYIPALWTNFQIEPWFHLKKTQLQNDLNDWVKEHPSENGYFVVVQYDDGPLLKLPHNTLVCGCCCGNMPIPLIYEDKHHKLEHMPKKSFLQKNILCSFVGNITSNHVVPNVRKKMFDVLSKNKHFRLIDSGGWKSNVHKKLQDVFIETTLMSKFALAPRGYGRGSFRFFECFQLGTIPLYIWNDVNWLPFQDTIDYSKLCVVIHIDEIHTLEDTLLNISEQQYNHMFDYYSSIKHLFELGPMCDHLVRLL